MQRCGAYHESKKLAGGFRADYNTCENYKTTPRESIKAGNEWIDKLFDD
jgi:hypothetical protein